MSRALELTIRDEMIHKTHNCYASLHDGFLVRLYPSNAHPNDGPCSARLFYSPLTRPVNFQFTNDCTSRVDPKFLFIFQLSS